MFRKPESYPGEICPYVWLRVMPNFVLSCFFIIQTPAHKWTTYLKEEKKYASELVIFKKKSRIKYTESVSIIKQ